MTLLCDYDLRRAIENGHLTVDPLDDSRTGALQPASIDLTLDRHFEVLTPGTAPINPASDNAGLFQRHTVDDGAALQLDPGECALGATYERIRVGEHHAARVEGKSSLGRLFLLVHATAGFIDPGFHGHLTLELVNLGPRPILLWPGMRIAQLTVQALTQQVISPYGEARVGSRYQGQPRGPVLSRSHERFAHGLPAEQTGAAA